MPAIAAQQFIPCCPPVATAPGAPPKPTQLSAFVISWEDVLAPMSFLAKRLELQPTRSSLETAKAAYAQDRYLQQALASVEEEAVELLRTAATIGPVFIVTEKSIRYMEATCSAFLPRLAQWLAIASNAQHFRVRVLAAPQKFATTTESSAWLARTYQQIVKISVWEAHGASISAAGALGHAQQLLRHRESGTLGLVSISASAASQAASLRALDVAPFLIPKGVHVPGGDPASALNLEHFFAQLMTLQGYMSTAAAHDSAFSMTL
ncbi:Protein unc-50 [Phytophthora pseudosyringae]|uniref:Protein unc-50 n=1 Tax=Phytophthora pseudosyringae TaxID=221518 RepID=A0A8T1WGI6_9STRA|nr:Protein unc-50 [Phytophthora pseudosyringae]